MGSGSIKGWSMGCWWRLQLCGAETLRGRDGDCEKEKFEVTRGSSALTSPQTAGYV
jgi:hypothetical protein